MLKIRDVVYQNGERYIIAGFGGGLWRSYVWYKESGTPACLTECFVNKQKSIRATLQKIHKNRMRGIQQQITIFDNEIKELLKKI